MSGHNKFSKIKHKKAATDGQKSKIFGKYSKLITMEAKKANGNVESPGLKAVIARARTENMTNDTIDKAIKKATEAGNAVMEEITYEAYGPGGTALMIEVLTDNKNRAAAEVRHILSKTGGLELAATGSASWAFSRNDEREWIPNSTVPIEEKDGEKLEKLIEALEDNEDIQGVYTNAE
jgi:YebC/PmpR family DNA-binding regulatory protein